MFNSEKQSIAQNATEFGETEPLGHEKTGTAQDQKDMFRLGKKQELNVRE